MDQITGLQEMRFLTQSGSDAGRLAQLAREVGVLAWDADPDIAEWESTLLDLRRALSGPRISAELSCPECGEGAALIFGVDDLPRVGSAISEIVSGYSLRPLRLGDLERIETAPGDRLAAILSQAADKPVEWAQQMLGGVERDTVIAALDRCLAGLDIQLGTACTACNAEIVSPFDVQAFVLAELTTGARVLLDQVHVIARTYHWAEVEILSLPRDRRLAYLDRIDRDALRIEVGHG